MDNLTFDHIFLGHDYYDRIDYTSPRKGGDRRNIPNRNTQEHARTLRNRLDTAWNEALRISKDRRAVALPTRSGVYLEFQGDPDHDLISQSLEARTSGIRLLSVSDRIIEGEDTPVSIATLFVPTDKKTIFLRKIERYKNETTPSGKPKHQRLINSISDIKRAVLSSFWQDSAEYIPDENFVWCEAWIRVDETRVNDIEVSFRSVCQALDVPICVGSLRFPERSVLRIHANAEKLTELLEASDHIAEFRLAKETARFWLDQPNLDQSDWVQDLIARLDVKDSNVAICILDTGVNNLHPLIEPVLMEDDCHSVEPAWGVDDHDKHGTLMAGLAIYGDLQDVLLSDQSIEIVHILESSKILPREGDNPSDLYGFVTAQGISQAEISAPDRKRIICLAVTSLDYRDHGRPSSWSAEIDNLAAGSDDNKQRLIIISAGNTRDSSEWRNYPDAILTNEVHDPGQSWNALTVGATTYKTTIEDEDFAGFIPIAEAGSISPFSSTSLTWDKLWPAKPDILMEGGNAAYNENGDCLNLDDLSLLSTYYKPQDRHFANHSMTSAASALAARLAAKLQFEYPDAWPETIRALIVHSAEWTQAMKDHFLPDESKNSYSNLVHICGYGIPNYDRAIHCARDNLTLITEQIIQPYTLDGGKYKTQDMHIHELPWPRDILLNLGDSQITMRVTLSYFIEAGPGQIGWRYRYRYASHGLRFDVNSPGESRDDFLVRLNQAARADGQEPQTSSQSGRWKIGSTIRDRGSIHSDIWRGSAAEIAGSNLVGIYPVIGWWRERHHLGRWNKQARYSLIVSLHSPEQLVDIYTPVVAQIGLVAPVEIDIAND